MIRKIFSKKAVSIIEYVALLTFLMAAVFLAQKYLVRGIAGRWKEVGDTFGYGRQYDPKKTTECVWHEDPYDLAFNTWYVPQCFEKEYNRNYSTYFKNCYRDCKDDGSWGSCSVGPSKDCCIVVFWFTLCSDYCCYNACEQKCKATVARGSANAPACQRAGAIRCNE